MLHIFSWYCCIYKWSDLHLQIVFVLAKCICFYQIKIVNIFKAEVNTVRKHKICLPNAHWISCINFCYYYFWFLAKLPGSFLDFIVFIHVSSRCRFLQAKHDLPLFSEVVKNTHYAVQFFVPTSDIVTGTHRLRLHRVSGENARVSFCHGAIFTPASKIIWNQMLSS